MQCAPTWLIWPWVAETNATECMLSAFYACSPHPANAVANTRCGGAVSACCCLSTSAAARLDSTAQGSVRYIIHGWLRTASLKVSLAYLAGGCVGWSWPVLVRSKLPRSLTFLVLYQALSFRLGYQASITITSLQNKTRVTKGSLGFFISERQRFRRPDQIRRVSVSR